LDDIQASIRELKFYREHIFIPVEPVSAKEEAATGEARKTAL